jgi:hypothetical protein
MAHGSGHNPSWMNTAWSLINQHAAWNSLMDFTYWRGDYVRAGFGGTTGYFTSFGTLLGSGAAGGGLLGMSQFTEAGRKFFKENYGINPVSQGGEGGYFKEVKGGGKRYTLFSVSYVFVPFSEMGSASSGNNKEFPSFETLWNNYPQSVNGSPAHPSTDNYPNQCAIRLGYCLQNAGVDMSNYNTGPLTTDGYPRGSKSLADWIWKEFGRPLILTQADFKSAYWSQTGIIYISPYSGGIGHIDLFNSGTTGSGYYLGEEIWFWIIK